MHLDLVIKLWSSSFIIEALALTQHSHFRIVMQNIAYVLLKLHSGCNLTKLLFTGYLKTSDMFAFIFLWLLSAVSKMVVFPVEKDCIFSYLCQGSEGRDSCNVILNCYMLLKSNTVLVSLSNGCFPSESREDVVIQQTLYLFVFCIYFCTDQRVSVKGSVHLIKSQLCILMWVYGKTHWCCHPFNTEGKILWEPAKCAAGIWNITTPCVSAVSIVRKTQHLKQPLKSWINGIFIFLQFMDMDRWTPGLVIESRAFPNEDIASETWLCS